MKKLFENIKSGLIVGITAFIVIVLGGIIYASWTSPTNLKANPGNALTSDLWNKTQDNIEYIFNNYLMSGSLIPPGAVMAFDLETCPTGWLPANGDDGRIDLRGEFIRGLDDGRGIDTGRTLRSSQEDTFQGHGHYNKYSTSYQSYGTSGSGWQSNFTTSRQNATTIIAYIRDAADIGYGEPKVSNETRPRNVALLYCIKE